MTKKTLHYEEEPNEFLENITRLIFKTEVVLSQTSGRFKTEKLHRALSHLYAIQEREMNTPRQRREANGHLDDSLHVPD